MADTRHAVANAMMIDVANGATVVVDIGVAISAVARRSTTACANIIPGTLNS